MTQKEEMEWSNQRFVPSSLPPGFKADPVGSQIRRAPRDGSHVDRAAFRSSGHYRPKCVHEIDSGSAGRISRFVCQFSEGGDRGEVEGRREEEDDRS